MKPYIAAQFSPYGIYEAVSHSTVRPVNDPCMSRTFVSGKAGVDFHVTVGWYVWERHPELNKADENTLRDASGDDVEVEILEETAAAERMTAYTLDILTYTEEDELAEYTASRMAFAGEEEKLRAVLVLYRAGDSDVESLTDEELWDLPVTVFDNEVEYDPEKFLLFRKGRS